MLRAELKDSDIPHRTTLRTRILERLNEYFEALKKEMAVRDILFLCLFILILVDCISDKLLGKNFVHYGSLE